MPTKVEENNVPGTVQRFPIQCALEDYTYPSDARIHNVRFDEKYMHVELLDGRVLSIPLWWIPTLYNADLEEREKYEISRDRRLIIWDPKKCAINEEVRIEGLSWEVMNSTFWDAHAFAG